MSRIPSLFPVYSVSETLSAASSSEKQQSSLFPAYGGSAAEIPLPEESPQQIDWLCNPSYDPTLAPSPMVESEHGGSKEALPEVPHVLVESEEERDDIRREKKKKKKKGRQRDPIAPLPSGPTTFKRKFHFLTGFSGEELFFLDPKPDKGNLAFDMLPFTQAAVFHKGWCCDVLPPSAHWAPRKALRYWHPKARRQKCIASIATPKVPFSAGRSYIPIYSPAPKSVAVDPLGIHDRATQCYIQGQGVPTETQELEKEVVPLDASLRQAELQQRLERTPGDEHAWLDLVAFQDEFVAAMEDASGIHRTHGRARAIREKKLAVLEQALLRTRGSVSLHLLKIQVLLECGEEVKASKAWEELLRVHPSNSRLWLEHARFLQSERTLSGFEVGPASRAYLRALACFRDMLEGRRSTKKSPQEVERHIVEVCRQYGVFLCQCGQWERGVGTLQALLELNLRCPSRLESEPLDQVLALLEPFWDSGAPRFGEPQSRGWDRVMGLKDEPVLQAHTAIREQEEELEMQEDAIVSSGRDLRDTWLSLESLRDLRHWLPHRPDLTAEQVGCDDPERMVLFEDVSSALFRLRHPESKVALLCALVSLLLGGDAQSGKNAPSEPVLSEADCFERLPGVEPSEAVNFSEALGFPWGWEVRRGAADFAEEVLRQAEEALDPSGDLADKLGALQMRVAQRAGEWSAKRRKKMARAVLSNPKTERQLDLWTDYGLLLLDLGEDPTAVYEKTLDMVSRPGVLAECRGDLWRLLATYLDLCLGLLTWRLVVAAPVLRDRILKVLSWADLSRRFSEVVSKPLQSSSLLRAAAKLELAGTPGAVRVSLWLKYFMSGFQVAAAFAKKCITEAAVSPDTALLCLREAHKAEVCLLTYHARQGASLRYPGGALRNALSDVPDCLPFLSQLVAMESGALGAMRTRRLLDELIQKQCSPLAWLVGLCFELRRADLLNQYRTDEASFIVPSCGNHLRRIFERALESVAHRRCPLLWRLYVSLEMRYGTRDSAKAIFYRALQSCPWAKVLYVDGVRHFPECLQEVADMIVEKGIRLRAPLEEVQLLLDNAASSKNDGPLKNDDITSDTGNNVA